MKTEITPIGPTVKLFVPDKPKAQIIDFADEAVSEKIQRLTQEHECMKNTLKNIYNYVKDKPGFGYLISESSKVLKLIGVTHEEIEQDNQNENS